MWSMFLCPPSSSWRFWHCLVHAGSLHVSIIHRTLTWLWPCTKKTYMVGLVGSIRSVVFVPMQCTRNSGCFPRGKRAATVRRYPAFVFPLCAVCSCFHTTGCQAYSFTTDGYGIFNVCTNLGAWSTCIRKGGQTQRSMHKGWLGATQNSGISPCPARGSNPGPSV